MKLKKSQIQFIINCDVEEMVNELHTEYHLPLIDAFDAVYNSQLYQKLIDTNNGLYIQSPLYQLSYLKEELKPHLDPLQ
jgi:hypothetical protein